MKRGLWTLVLGLVTAAGYAQWSNPGEDVPAYHPDPPAKGAALPPVMAGAQLTGQYFVYPWQKAVYQQAAQIQKVLYQLPCFCRCDRAMGHSSLHSCFEGTHGALCATCLKELYYSYSMHQKGKTAVEIRQGIIRGDWKQVDLKTAASNN